MGIYLDDADGKRPWYPLDCDHKYVITRDNDGHDVVYKVDSEFKSTITYRMLVDQFVDMFDQYVNMGTGYHINNGTPYRFITSPFDVKMTSMGYIPYDKFNEIISNDGVAPYDSSCMIM